jgi:SNF2 family DNA or RNA helicase
VGGLKLRPYQQEAHKALLETRSLLLADDPGTGKAITAAAALSFLMLEGKAKRALVVCSVNRLQHWEKQLTTWGPGLVVNSVRNFKGHTSHVWSDPSQAILMDYEQLAADFDQGLIDETELAFDVLILADILAVPRQTDRIFAPLKKVSATWRWGLSGSIPQSSQEWVRLFEILIPEPKHEDLKRQLSDPCLRYLPFVMRREKTEIAGELPNWNRQELWLDLLDAQRDHYLSVLAEERDRLMRIGSKATSKDVNLTLIRLSQATHALGDSFDGPKVRALLEQVEAIAASGGKVVVFCHDQHGEMDNLITALESFKTVRLDANASLEERTKVRAAMRHEPSVRVLLAHVDAKTDGLHLEGPSYIIHFDAGLNAESSRKAEWTIFPMADPPLPVNVFELWIAQTHEEQLHALISSRLPEHAKDPFARPLPEWYQPLTIDDWLTAVLQIGSHGEKALASG